MRRKCFNRNRKVGGCLLHPGKRRPWSLPLDGKPAQLHLDNLHADASRNKAPDLDKFAGEEGHAPVPVISIAVAGCLCTPYTPLANAPKKEP